MVRVGMHWKPRRKNEWETEGKSKTPGLQKLDVYEYLTAEIKTKYRFIVAKKGKVKCKFKKLQKKS